MKRLGCDRFGLSASVLAIAAGCNGLTLHTESVVRSVGPLETRASVTMAPAPDPGPVVAMPLGGGPCLEQGPKVAVIDVDGPLVNRNAGAVGSYGENPVNLFREKLAAAEAMPGLVAVVLRVNSPGGSVAATEIMVDHRTQFRERTRKPVVACVLDVGAGGAYYLAGASDLLVAYPGSLVGGIGVVINLYNLREALATINVLPQTVKSGENIDLGTVNQALSPQAESILRNLAAEFHGSFVATVRRARPRLPPPPAEVYDGRIYSGRRALAAGLVDRVGTLEEALAIAAEMGGRPDASPVLLHRAGDVARTLFAVTRNEPATAGLAPLSIPGLSHREMPTFLYMWDPSATAH